jgi:CheY-like chemotaxis protein
MACVLVIDDYASFREAMEYCLPKFGHIGVSAATALAAAEQARRHRIDVILADIGLPALTGLAICASLRRDPLLAGTPILVLSGIITPDIVGRARAAGAREVLPKPFQWPHLMSALDRVLTVSP